MPTPRVLLIAEQCNPEWQSVPLVGWSHCRAIAARTESHLVTQIRNRDAFSRAGLVEGRDFTAIDSEAISRPVWKLTNLIRGGSEKGYTTVMAFAPLGQWYFEQLVWRRFRDELQSGRFSVVHRVTPMSPAVPSSLAKKCHRVGVPFVLGPLNGGLPWPKEFAHLRRREHEWLAKVRSAHKLLPGYRATRKYASAILVGSRSTFEQLPARYRDKAFYMPENALDLARFTRQREETYDGPLRILFVGRLVPFKNPGVVLEASAELLRRGEATLTIVGDGPELPSLQSQAAALGVESAVRFVGSVPHAELQNYYATSDVFAFPSIRELGGAVVLEAMALGCVPVVVDYGGPPEFLSPEIGVCIDLGPHSALVSQLSACLRNLAAAPDLLARMSAAATDRARTHFTWEAKAELDAQVYDWVLCAGPKPVSPPPDCGALLRGDDLPGLVGAPTTATIGI